MAEENKELLIEAIQKIELNPGDILVAKVDRARWVPEMMGDINSEVIG